MKLRNRILSLFLSVIMIFSLVPLTASATTISGTCGDNVTWDFDYKTQTLTISGFGNTYNYDKYSSDRPFENLKKEIKYVKIEQGVITVGDYMFYNYGAIIKVELPDSIQSIGTGAFMYCRNLTVSIAANISSIGKSAFYSQYNSISINYRGTTKQWREFEKTNNYQIMYRNVQCFDDLLYPSGECGDNLVWEFNTETSILTISGTGEMHNYYSPWHDYLSYIKSVVVNEGVTSIGDEAFCTDPDGFSDASSAICSVSLPDSLTTIGDRAFERCKNLKEIEIPDNVIEIGSWAFEECINLISVVLSEKTVKIGDYCFDKCEKLQEITFPDSVIEIGICAFRSCYMLSDIELPSNLITIGTSAFASCNSLKKVIIPHSVTYIGQRAFAGCASLVGVYVDEKNEHYKSDDGVLYNKDKTTLIFYPLGKQDRIFKVSDDVTTIGSYAFGCDFPYLKAKIYCLIFPESLTNVEYRAFYNMEETSSIIGLSGLKICYTGSQMQWESIIIADGNQAINDADVYYDFNGVITRKHTDDRCTSCLNVDAGVYSITGKGQLTHNNMLDEFESIVRTTVISPGVTKIGRQVFSNYTELTTVMLPSSVTQIDKSAFIGCPQIKDVYYSGTESQWQTIATDAFDNATIHYNCCEVHDFKVTDTSPSCLNKGVITVKCASCDASYTNEYGYPLGHNYTKTGDFSSTCTAHGYIQYTCESCGFVSTDYTSNPTGHSLNDEGVCEVCGEKEVSASHINTQMLSVESVLAMVMSLLAKLLSIFTVA